MSEWCVCDSCITDVRPHGALRGKSPHGVGDPLPASLKINAESPCVVGLSGAIATTAHCRAGGNDRIAVGVSRPRTGPHQPRITAVSGDLSSAIGLPGEVVLLLHKPAGGAHGTNPQVATAAAEVAELAARHRVIIRRRKLGGATLSLLDSSPFGVDWLDSVVDRLDRMTRGGAKTIDLGSWLTGKRSKAFIEHRARLVTHDLLTEHERKLLGFISYRRHEPDRLVREGIIAELRRVARVEQPVDNRLALLAAIAHGCGLAATLGFDRQERRMLKSLAKGEQLGQAVEEAVAAAAAAVAGACGAAAVGGGDGGGGGGGGS